MDTSDEHLPYISATGSGSRYQQIACDLASKIADGTYPEGHRLYGRSALAGQYGVSSETVRRAVCILEEMGIVESKKRIGITILSQEKAIHYLRHFHQTDSLAEIKHAIVSCAENQQSELKQLSDLLGRLVLRVEKFQSANPFVPYQVTVPTDCGLIGKSLQDIDFWHKTAATVVGIRHGAKLALSPGPDAELVDGDILYFIGDPRCVLRVYSLLGVKS